MNVATQLTSLFHEHPSISFVDSRLWIQGDNTPKELRNSFTGKWACMMTQANFFKSVSHHHMMVGHTHEDIGGEVQKLNIKHQVHNIVIYDVLQIIPASPVQMECSLWSQLQSEQRRSFTPHKM